VVTTSGTEPERKGLAMTVMSNRDFADHQEVVFFHDGDSGLRAIVAIHDTTLGPALGGCRMWPYTSEDEALTDVLRLSRGMTYKAAMAGLELGGGKAVIIGDPRRHKTEALLRRFGRFVDTLDGRYITAEDVGTSVDDMDVVRQVTDHVAGLGGLSGDPSPATAWGVFSGIRAAVLHRLGRDDLNGITVAVQGFGHVGRWLCRYLHQAGAKLLVADLRDEALEQAVAEFGAEIVPLEQILAAEADVLAPCALGAVLDDATIPNIRAGIVAGAANNQLAEPRHGEMLNRHGVLYAPDYVVNAGGIINIIYERPVYDREAAFRHIGGIFDTLTDLWRRAERAGLAPDLMADRIVEERLAAKRGLPVQLAEAS